MKIRRILRTSLVGLCLTLTIANSSHAKDWRGITPFHSTLADVVRRFGTCTTLNYDTCTHSLKDETVKFFFRPESCGTGKERLARQTIIRIELKPTSASLLSDYHEIDFYHFSSFFLRGANWGGENYINDADGFAAEAIRKVVTQVHYTAKADDIHLCPSSYVKPSDLLPLPEGAMVAECMSLDMSVSCPYKPVDVDQPITFSANVSNCVPYLRLTYTWSTSAGKIIAGQGTPSIVVDTKGLPGETEVRATLAIGGIPVEWNSRASCTSKISPRR